MSKLGGGAAVAALLLVLWVAAACSASAAEKGSAATGTVSGEVAATSDTQRDERASVTVEVTLLRGEEVAAALAQAGVGQGLAFEVSLDTHSVDLDSYDLAALARLEAPNVASTGSWVGDEGGGHHRGGYLVFEGTPQSDARLTLVIRGIGDDSERRFQW